ncbi:MAG: phage major capsid protein [Negativicutes bacterium]|nr:phage major capsid protein [Negativicutes bacterium]
MNKEQILAKIREKMAKQQTIVDLAKADSGRGMTEDEGKDFDNLQKEIDNLQSDLARAEKLEANAKFMDAPANPRVRPVDMDVQEDKLDDGGFKNIGELANALRFGDKKGRIANLSTGDVGILIPPAFAGTILQLNPEAEIIMPRATIIPAGDPPDAEFSIPYFVQGNSGALGGVSLTWTAESQDKPDNNDPIIADLTLKPQEVSGISTINNKTLVNWQACGAFIQNLLRQAFATGRDYKFLRGSGAGCPLGVLNAPGKIIVQRNTALTIKYVDVVSMLGRLLPDAIDNAFFLANLSSLPTLMQLADGQGRLILVLGDATKGIPTTLAGLPLKWTGKLPTVGNQGDLVLMSLDPYYLIKQGSGPFLAISEHSKFQANKTQFRIVANIDGQPWVKDPLLLEDGQTTVSPYIVLK